MLNAVARAFRFLVSGRFPLLTTWMLWRWFRYPAPHPLFWQLHEDTSKTKVLAHLGWMLFLGVPPLCCALWYALITLEETISGPLVVVVLFLSSSVYVSVWIIDITQTLIREQRQGTYDLLCATPDGAISVNQAICAASLHRHNALMWINLARQISGGFFLFILVMLLPLAASYQKPGLGLLLWRPFLEMVAIIVATYFDHAQTVALGCLVAMLVPVQRPRSGDAPILAISAFLMLQLLIFLLTALIITLLGIVFQLTGWSALYLPGLNLLAFYLIRETFNIVLWKKLVAQLDVSPTEAQVLA